MRTQKGSFTIEAIIWISCMLFLMLGILQEGIGFYRESAEKNFSEDIENWDGVSRFYEVWMLKELGENYRK